MSKDVKTKSLHWLVYVTQIAMGWVLFWAFIDKLFGLGFATAAGKGWLDGVSPTFGFLSHTDGWLAPVFQAIAGNVVVDWLFMLGLVGIGLALLFGVKVRLASVVGIIMMTLMWLAVLPPANNPIIDDHIIYIIVFIGLYLLTPDHPIHLGQWWRETFAKNAKWLQ